MSWLTETLDKISKSFEGLNTSAMQGAGSMGLLNIERASEKMNPKEAKEFKLKAKANLVTGTMLAPAVPLLINGLATAPVTTALELAGGAATGIGATVAADKAIEYGSDGKYTGFTDYVTKKFPDSNPHIVEQFHPAGWIGGLLGGWGTRNVFMRTPRGKVELVNSELSKNISNTKLDKSFPNTSYNPNNILYYQPKEVTYTPKTNSEKTYLGLLEKPSKLAKAERLGIPKGGKVPYTTEENLAFRNQINEFAKKYGYNTIGDEVTDPEVLEKYARALIKLHNTFYRGVSYAPDEATLMKWASQPRPDAEMYITPYSDVAKGYGDPVELLRPYKLGSDRTQWFTEGNFDIIPSAGDRISQGYSGKSGIYAPWVSRRPVLTSQGMVAPKPKSPESELVVINTNLIPKRVIYKMPVFSSYIKPNGEYRFSPWWKVGEMSPTGSKNLPNIHAEFKQGGSIHIKEKNKGKFTESAKRAGKSVQEHARDVVNNPKATKLQKKRALFALNAKKFKHD